MFTVTLGFDGSGNNSTRRPLGNEYSVMPPTDAFFSTPCGRDWANVVIAAITGIASRSWMRMDPLSLNWMDYNAGGTSILSCCCKEIRAVQALLVSQRDDGIHPGGPARRN